MLGTQINLLDHGFVRVVDHMGGDLDVSRAARVSYNAVWRAGQDTGSDERLIHRLWKDKHVSPFEAVVLKFEVKAPIFIFRQWHRHRTFSYSEVSARYSELPEEFYMPDVDKIGVQSKDNKQGRTLDAGETMRRTGGLRAYERQCDSAFRLYKDLLFDGWPRELARCVLPLATYSHMFATVNLRNLFGFLELRLDLHAQYEIRVYAEAILQLIEPIVPVCVAAFQEGRKA